MKKIVKTAIWCCFKATMECKPEDIPDINALKDKVEVYLHGETPFKEVLVTQLSIKSSCVLCNRFNSGEHIEGKTTVPLFVCKRCIKKYGYEGAQELLDRL